MFTTLNTKITWDGPLEELSFSTEGSKKRWRWQPTLVGMENELEEGITNSAPTFLTDNLYHITSLSSYIFYWMNSEVITSHKLHPY